MRIKSRPFAGGVSRASVISCYAYVFLFGVLSLWMICTVRAETLYAQVLGPGHSGLSLFATLSTVNVAWFALISFEVPGALRSPAERRKTDVSSVLLALLLLVALQFAVFAMRDAAQAFPPR